jgi:hypothetical protein
MIIDNLFENKKNTNESLADEFMAMARAKGMNPRLRGTPDEERARTDAMLKQRAADRANAPKPQPIDAETRAHLQDQLKSLEATFDPNYEYSDDHSFWKEQSSIAQQINRIKAELSKGVAESRRNKKRKLDESWLMEDPVYRKFKRVGRYIAERKLTEPEILKIFADAETGMTDKATGANRTFLGRGKDTTMDFAGGVADALKGVWSGIQSNVGVQAVDVAYDKATDALADLTGGQKGAIMQAIKKYRMLAKEYPKTAGLAKGALVAITGLATGGAGLPAVAALVYGLDSAIKGEKFSDIALKAGGAAATAWAASKIASMVGGDQAAAPDGSAGGIEAADQVYQGADTSQMLSTPLEQGVTVRCPLGSCNGNVWQAEPGQTLTDIAQQIGVDPAELAKLNPGLASPGGAYTVVKGDELGFIAQAQGTTPEAIRAANPDIDFSKALQKGQQLNLPTANTNTGSLWKDYQGGMYGDKVAGPELLGGPAAGDTTNLIQRPSLNIKPGDYPAAPEISPADVRSFGSGAPGSTSGTLSGVTGQQIASSPVYQQIYAQEIAKYGAEPSARAIQTAQQIATLKAKQAMAGVVRESTDWINKVKLRRLSVNKLIDQKLTTLSWALNESIGKPQGRSMHLTPLGVYTVFENIQRIAELDKVPTDELSPEEIARNERIRKMYQATQGRGLERAADGRLVGFVPDPDDPEGEGPNAQLYYDDDFNLIGTSKPIPGLEISKPTPGPTPAPTPAPKPGPAPTPTPTPSPAPAPARPTGEKLQQAADQLKTNVGKIPAEQIQNSMRALKDKGFGKGDPIYDTYAAEIQKRGIENVKKRVPTLKPEELQKGIDFFAQQKRGAGDPVYDIYAAELEKRTGKPDTTPTPTPTPSPTPTPAPKPGPTPTPSPTTPTGDAAGPGREALPDLLRPDMADAPTQPADPAKKSWFGRGLDALDRGTKAVGGALSTFGRQLTTGVTKEKLKMNWHQAGKPTDSDQLSAWLVKQGVPIGVVNGVYEKMGLPVSAEPVAATEPQATTEPQAKTGGAQRQMAFYGTNPKTQKPWTYDELQAKSQITPTSEPAPVEPDAAAKTTPGTLPQPTTTTVGQPSKVTYGKGFEKFMKPKTATQFPAFGTAGTAPAYKTGTTPSTPTVKTPVPATTATLPAGGGAGVKSAVPAATGPMKIGGQTLNPKNPADKKIIDKVQAQTAKVAEALKKPVAEMLTMVETKEDVAKIKQFIDQTFVKYGAVSESAFAVRNQLIEHVTQVGAQRRREFARKS